MANHSCAEKAHRQTLRRTQTNSANLSRVRTFVRKVEEALESKDKAAAVLAFSAAQTELMRGVQKGLFHKNTASRKVSRLAHRIQALA